MRMMNFWKQWKSEKGQTLPLVLALLAIGTLTIVPSLNYSTSSLNGSRSLAQGMKGTYAADAGIENALWSLQRVIPPPAQLTDNLNEMTVTIETETKGYYVLYFGELVEPGVHYEDYLDIAGQIVWDEEVDKYKYTITVTWLPNQGEPVIHMEAIGAKLPPNYSYDKGSAAGFASNLSEDEPEIVIDSMGAEMINWDFGTPMPSVSEHNPVATQTFYIIGTGELEGNYTWVVVNRMDIWVVGEISGDLNRITAIARRVEDGKTTARIVADALINSEDIYIISWQTVNY